MNTLTQELLNLLANQSCYDIKWTWMHRQAHTHTQVCMQNCMHELSNDRPYQTYIIMLSIEHIFAHVSIYVCVLICGCPH